MIRTGRFFASRFRHLLFRMALLSLLGVAYPSLARMTWSARAIDPSLVDALKKNDELLDQTLFGEQPPLFTGKMEKDHRVDFSDPRIKEEVQAWAAKRKAEVGDAEVDLDKAWHGIHYLLTGSVESNKTLASKVIMGGEDIGPDRGYGPARCLAKPSK